MQRRGRFGHMEGCRMPKLARSRFQPGALAMWRVDSQAQKSDSVWRLILVNRVSLWYAARVEYVRPTVTTNIASCCITLQQIPECLIAFCLFLNWTDNPRQPRTLRQKKKEKGNAAFSYELLEASLMLRKPHKVNKRTPRQKVSYEFSFSVFPLPTCHLYVTEFANTHATQLLWNICWGNGTNGEFQNNVLPAILTLLM